MEKYSESKYNETWDDFSERVTFEYYFPGFVGLAVGAVTMVATDFHDKLADNAVPLGVGVVASVALSAAARKLDMFEVRSKSQE